MKFPHAVIKLDKFIKLTIELIRISMRDDFMRIIDFFPCGDFKILINFPNFQSRKKKSIHSFTYNI